MRRVAGPTAPPADFNPVFVVGCPRSGTTLLATLLDRHSRIAIPPETEFFLHVFPRDGRDRTGAAHAQYVDRLFSRRRTADLGLDRAEITERFSRHEPSFANLFVATLECHAAKAGKARPGEKSPDHLRYVPRLLALYPRARVVCIVRDGRDVAVSLKKTPWGSRNIARTCAKWNYYAMLAERYRGAYPDAFLAVRFEDLVGAPREELARVTAFLGEAMEEPQLTAGASRLVPGWERAWKTRSGGTLDPARIGRWRASATSADRALMQAIMGGRLARWGYPADDGCAGLGVCGAVRAALYGESLGSRLFEMKRWWQAALGTLHGGR